jgi:LPXTG-motif cell wall-anchored protein
LKKLIMLVCLVAALMPQSVKAERGDHDRDDNRHKRHMNANEPAGIGIGVAALIGAAGYLLVRRRSTV